MRPGVPGQFGPEQQWRATHELESAPPRDPRDVIGLLSKADWTRIEAAVREDPQVSDRRLSLMSALALLDPDRVPTLDPWQWQGISDCCRQMRSQADALNPATGPLRDTDGSPAEDVSILVDEEFLVVAGQLATLGRLEQTDDRAAVPRVWNRLLKTGGDDIEACLNNLQTIPASSRDLWLQSRLDRAFAGRVLELLPAPTDHMRAHAREVRTWIATSDLTLEQRISCYETLTLLLNEPIAASLDELRLYLDGTLGLEAGPPLEATFANRLACLATIGGGGIEPNPSGGWRAKRFVPPPPVPSSAPIRRTVSTQ